MADQFGHRQRRKKSSPVNSKLPARYIAAICVILAFVTLIIFMFTKGIVSLIQAQFSSSDTITYPEPSEISDFLDIPKSGRRLYCTLPEPWIAVRRESKEEEWHVLCSSRKTSLTVEDLAEMKAVVFCEDHYSESRTYEIYQQGMSTGKTETKHSYSVSINCYDPRTGNQIGWQVHMDAPSLPSQMGLTKIDFYNDDALVSSEVRSIAASTVAPGARADVWQTAPLTGKLVRLKTDLYRAYRLDDCAVLPVPEKIETFPLIKSLSEDVRRLYLPPTVTKIEDHALDGILFIIVEPGSYAEQYAKDNGITYYLDGDELPGNIY